MKTLEIVQRADADKMVRIAVPVEEASRKYRLVVIFEPEASETEFQGLDEWPPGFIDRTFGAWKGEFERAPQGDYEERTPF